MKNVNLSLAKKENVMRVLQVLLIVGCLAIVAIAASTGAHSGNVKVIANSKVSVDAISVDELKDVFLQSKSSLSDGTQVHPVLEKGGPAHETFLKQYLGKTDAALQTYYRGLVFTGKAPMPKMFDSDAEVITYVAKTKGAIGYVSSATSTEGVKTLVVK
jgi:ABC-type phosphate transport system substrate-binding protein